MGRKKGSERQEALWLTAADLPRSAGHPFYKGLNRIFVKEGFDEFVEGLCAKFYAERMGRPSLRPGRYFRLLLVGSFEGLESERAIAWRVADSLSLREFLELGVSEGAPDHSTLSRTRRLLDLETHEEVFVWVLKRVRAGGLLRGRTVGIEATTLEANAAMRSIVRRKTGESYERFLRRLALASGVPTPTRAQLARRDRKRRKRVSNKEWAHRVDADAQIGKMKDGRTHMAHKVEQAVDMETGAVVAVTVQEAGAGAAQLHRRTAARAARQAARASGGVRQPAAHSWGAGAAPVAPARRAAGETVCPSVRQRRFAPGLAARASQHPQTAADPCLRLESGAAHAPPDGQRYATQPTRLRHRSLSCRNCPFLRSQAPSEASPTPSAGLLRPLST